MVRAFVGDSTMTTFSAIALVLIMVIAPLFRNASQGVRIASSRIAS
jgi:hypothetical protein